MSRYERLSPIMKSFLTTDVTVSLELTTGSCTVFFFFSLFPRWNYGRERFAWKWKDFRDGSTEAGNSKHLRRMKSSIGDSLSNCKAGRKGMCKGREVDRSLLEARQRVELHLETSDQPPSCRESYHLASFLSSYPSDVSLTPSSIVEAPWKRG